MAAQSKFLPLREADALTNRHVSQLIDELNGEGPGIPVHIRNALGTFDLLSIDDTGVKVSATGQAATTPFAMVGMVVMWAGTVATIPAGWHICDGTNGTPDLRSRFILGANVDAEVGVASGAATADISHLHPHTATHLHPHTATHDHVIPNDTGVTDNPDDLRGGLQTGGAAVAASEVHGHQWVHDHFGTALPETPGPTDPAAPGSTNLAGTTTLSLRPPAVSLFYIMRIAP